jgi:hypothetical protein
MSITATVGGGGDVLATDSAETCDVGNFNDTVWLLNSAGSAWVEQIGICGYIVNFDGLSEYLVQEYDAGGPDQEWQVLKFAASQSGTPSIGAVGASTGAPSSYEITAFAAFGDAHGGLAYLTDIIGPNGSNLWVANWGTLASTNIKFASNTFIESLSFDWVTQSGLYFAYNNGDEVLKLTVSQLSTGSGLTL